ncbi:hypothetical protein [Streptomyces sp. NPDC047990]|uniref:hypothetical protein n=1 Tax=Streptomyces sp. NPDC047990 TaxID=3365496 RepID=UPI0037183F31
MATLEVPMQAEAKVRDVVHFWSGGACRTARVKHADPIRPGLCLLEVQLPGEESVDVWTEIDEGCSENSWHPAGH